MFQAERLLAFTLAGSALLIALLDDDEVVFRSDVAISNRPYLRHIRSRTHLSLAKQCPFPRLVSSIGRIIEIPQLSGLHHRYERVAA
jgi:hypothetical protein